VSKRHAGVECSIDPALPDSLELIFFPIGITSKDSSIHLDQSTSASVFLGMASVAPGAIIRPCECANSL
jgi:hypothetical protein